MMKSIFTLIILSLSVFVNAQNNTIGSCEMWIDPFDTEHPNYPLEEGETYLEAPNNSDDGSNGPIEFGFDFCFFGDTVNQFYINNNGNISFDGSYGTFSPEGFPSENYTMVSPFWSDVNMAVEGGDLYYAITDHAVYMNWIEVGYYGSDEEGAKNSFQLILTDGMDPILSNGNNVGFTYFDMNWTTGTASAGTDGFGGFGARIGANYGDGESFICLGEFNENSSQYNGPIFQDNGVHWLDGKHFEFSTCDSDPIYIGDLFCDVVVCESQSFEIIFAKNSSDNLAIELDFEEGVFGEFEVVEEDGLLIVDLVLEPSVSSGDYDIEISIINSDTEELMDSFIAEFSYINEEPIGLEIAGPNLICQGELVALSITNSSDFTNILWNGTNPMIVNDLPEMDTTYTVTAMDDNGCLVDSIHVVTVVPPMEVSFTRDGNWLIADEGSSYQWYLDGQPITDGTTQWFEILEDGTYYVEITDEFGCVNVAEEEFLVVNIKEYVIAPIKVYPNPTSNYLNIISYQDNIKEVRVLSMEGKVIKSHRYIKTLDVSSIAPGSYIIEAVLENEEVGRKIFLKN